MPKIVTRTLEPWEHPLAIAAGGPLHELAQPDGLKDMAIAVVEVDDQIVAYWVVWYALHLEPLWVREDHRKSPAVIKGIIDQMRAVVEASGEPVAYCEIADENLAVVGDYADRLGFQPAPGKLFYLVVPQPELVKG